MNSTYCPCSYSFILKFLIFVIFFFCRLMTNCKNAIYLKEWVQIVSLVYELWIIELLSILRKKFRENTIKFLHCFHPGWILTKKQKQYSHTVVAIRIFLPPFVKLFPHFLNISVNFFSHSGFFTKSLKVF